MKPEKLCQKKVVYRGKKLYVLNNTDDEVLDQDSDFSLASVTKIFTALAALILDEEGVIKLEDQADKYLKSKQLKGITIQNLINHTSGLKRDYEGYNHDIGMKKEYKNLTDLFQEYEKEKLNTGKIGKMNYSNVGYNVLGALLESATGETFENIVNEKIFKPLEMKNSGFGKTKTTLYNFNKKKMTRLQWNEISSCKGDGGIKSTVSDLLKFRFFTRLINKKSLEKMKSFIFVNFDDKEGIWGISHSGLQHGVKTRLVLKYDKFWKPKFQLILLATNDETFY